MRRFHLVSVFLVFVLGASASAFSQSAAAKQSQHLYLDRSSYCEPECKYLQEDVDNYRFRKANKLALARYTGSKLNPAGSMAEV